MITLKKIVKKAVKACLPYGFIVLYRLFRECLQEKQVILQRLKKRDKLRLVIHLVDHCNLNCKGCDNFSPLADVKFNSLEIMEKDWKRIYDLTDKGKKIEKVELQGGEPLLHHDLLKIIGVAGKYFGNSDLSLTTNGILLVKQPDQFWETCKNNNVKVVITKYPINLQFGKIEEIAKEHGTTLQYYGDTGEVLKQMLKMPLNLQGTENNRKSFELCYKSNTCIYLNEGKIYTCATIPYIKYFNKYFGTNMEVSEKDYIDIYAVKSIEEVFDFLCKPMPFCRYCNTKKPVLGINWETSKKEISEWI
jgi:MoaA/NifB/PqqE/SkfB family radical SAM enzyme